MFRPAILLHVILLGLAGFLAFEVAQVWIPRVSQESGGSLPAGKAGSQEAGVRTDAIRAPDAQPAPPQGQETGVRPREAYQVVALKNPFRPTRTDWDGGGKRVDRPKVYLYGVTLAGEYQAALLAVGPPGKGRGARLYKLGDQVGGYTLKEIKADQVSLALGEDVFTVMLHDTAKPRVASPAPPVQAGAPPTPSPPSQPTVQPAEPPAPSSVDKRRKEQLERIRRLQTGSGSGAGAPKSP